MNVNRKAVYIYPVLLLIAIAVLFMIMVCGSSSAETIYVDKDGNDFNGDGSEEKPYRTIGKGEYEAENGDTVFVKAGEYREKINIEKEITLQGESNETSIISGRGLSGQRVVYIKADNVIISDLSIIDGNYDGDPSDGIYTSDHKNIIVQNCLIYNNRFGIDLSGDSIGHRIINCSIHDCKNNICIGSGGKDIEVVSSELYNAEDEDYFVFNSYNVSSIASSYSTYEITSSEVIFKNYLSGQVKNGRSGEPIPNLALQVREEGEVISTSKTDANGIFGSVLAPYQTITGNDPEDIIDNETVLRIEYESWKGNIAFDVPKHQNWLNVTYWNWAPEVKNPIPDFEVPENTTWTYRDSPLKYKDYFKDDYNSKDQLEYAMKSFTNSSYVNVTLGTTRLLVEPLDEEWTGVVRVVLSVTDREGNTNDSNAFNITFYEINDPPEITDYEHTPFIDKRGAYYNDVDATDIDSPDIEYGIDTDASFLGIDNATGVVSGTSSNSDVGEHYLHIFAFDGENKAWVNLTLTVNDTNTAPEFSGNLPAAKLNIPGGNEESYVIEVLDIDDNDIEWDVLKNLSFVQVVENPTNLTFTLSPHEGDEGEYYLNITASDAEFTIFHNISVSVVPADTEAPVVSVTSHASGDTVSGTTTISGTASDNVKIDMVELSVDGGAWEPVTGTASWSYDWDTTVLVDDDHALRFRAYDGRYYSGIVELPLKVKNTAENTIPTITITSPVNNSITTGAVIISGAAHDDDGDGTIQKVEVSINGGSWIGATGTTSWDFSWDTTQVANGDYEIRLRAFDGEAYSEVAVWKLTVDNQDVNPPDDDDDDDDDSPGFGVALLLAAAFVAVGVALRRKRRY